MIENNDFYCVKGKAKEPMPPWRGAIALLTAQITKLCRRVVPEPAEGWSLNYVEGPEPAAMGGGGGPRNPGSRNEVSSEGGDA